MSKTLKIGAIALMIVAAIATIGAGTALAQDEAPPGGFGPGHAHGPGIGRGLLQIDEEGLHEALAQELGMNLVEFEDARASGTTLVQLADENGSDIDALKAILDEFRADAIAEAVEEGLITQDQADQMLERAGSGFGSGRRSGECDGSGPEGDGPFGRGARGRSGPRQGS